MQKDYKIIITESKKEKFWEKVDKRSVNECWNFKGSISSRNGYGRFCIESGKTVNAQRVSWTIFFGEIPNGMFICHHCDNRKCVNPKHLFLGTRQDNINDMMLKKRSRHFNKNEYYGVIWEERSHEGKEVKGRWRSFICIKGKIKKLGAHTSILEAARNYDRIAFMRYGIKDKLNFPQDYDLTHCK